MKQQEHSNLQYAQYQQINNSQDQSQNQPHQKTMDFQHNVPWIIRKLFFIQTLLNLIDVKQKISENQSQKVHNKLSLNDVADIRQSDDPRKWAEDYRKQFDLYFQTHQQITYNDLVKIIFNVHFYQILYVTLMNLLNLAARLTFSILLYKLFRKVQANDLSDAYIYAILLGILSFVDFTSTRNCFQDAIFMAGRLRSGLTLFFYQKMIRMSSYTIKKNQIGKIINVMSEDFNSIRVMINALLGLLVLPITFVAVLAVLIARLGYIGIICIIIPIFSLLLKNWIGKIQSKYLTQSYKYKDSRIKEISQIIDGFKVIKIHAWEFLFQQKCQKQRQNQVHQLIKVQITKLISKAIANIEANIAAFICFVFIFFTDPDSLNVAKMFSTLQLMAFLKIIIYRNGNGIIFYYQVKVILQRLVNLLNVKNTFMVQINLQTKQILNKNQKQQQSKQVKNTKQSIKIKNLTAYWNLDQTLPSLTNIQLQFNKNKLYGIGGLIGSGKSTLISLIIKQIPYFNGFIQVNGRVGYVQQQPCIFSTTVKENILFGRNYNQKQYQNALKYSFLNQDIKNFTKGDQTQIGFKGITLSGGQKVRLSLARALYANPDIYLFDDPVSAVDPKISKGLFYDTIKRYLLKSNLNKTIIFVSHNVDYLSKCDEVVILRKGQIYKHDTPNKLKEELHQLRTNQQFQNNSNEQIDLSKNNYQKRQTKNQMKIQNNQKINQKSNQIKEKNQKIISAFIPTQKKQLDVKLTYWSYPIYLFYLTISKILTPLGIILFISNQLTIILFFRLLANYDNQKLTNQKSIFNNMNQFWVSTFVLLMVTFLTMIIKYFILSLMVLKTNEKLHNDMLSSLIKANLSYIQTTSSGQLISRFSNDLSIIDTQLPTSFTGTLQHFLTILLMLVSVVQIIHIFLFIVGTYVILVIILFLYSKQAILQTQQLQLKQRSPIITKLNQMIHGVIPIAIYNKKRFMIKNFQKAVRNSLRAIFIANTVYRVLLVYVQYFGSTILLIGIIAGLYSINTQQLGLYAVSVLFLIRATDSLGSFLTFLTVVQRNMISFQRILALTKIQSQKKLIDKEEVQNKSIKKEFQKQISISHLSLKYRQQLEIVLKDISFSFQKGQKVGIVGRTGAGKSSIFQALLRLVEPEIQTQYQIGNLNALELSLHQLRKNISVVPQNPHIFEGSIKFNIDPLGQKSESQILSILDKTGLGKFIAELPQGIYTKLSKSKQLFSIGQKQLLCLSRALIQENQLIILDEATANIDIKTDEFIQNYVRSHLQQKTIVIIAHRLISIADSDRIIVLDYGKIKQTGSPQQLMNKKGIFFEMVEHSSDHDKIKKKINQSSKKI